MTTSIAINPRYPTLDQKPTAVQGINTQCPQYRGLRGFFPFLEGGGFLTSDHARKTVNFGTLNTTPTWRGGKFGTCLDFTGAAARVTWGGGASTLDIRESVTISCWVYTTAANQNGVYPRVCSKLQSSGGFNGFEFLRAANDAGSGLVINSMYLQIAQNGTLIHGSDATAITLGVWTHFAASYNQSSGQFRIYRNGKLTNTHSRSANGNRVSTQDFTIGGHVSFDRWNGKLDLIAVWDRVVTDGEIDQMYQKPLLLLHDDQPSRKFFVFSGQIEESLGLSSSCQLGIQDGGTLYRTRAVDGISAITLASQFVSFPTLTVSAAGAVTLTAPFFEFLTIAGVGAITLLPGQQYVANFAIEGTANLTLTPGIGYFDTVPVAGVSNLTMDEDAFTLLTLTIDGIADIDVETLQNGRIGLTVAGISAITTDPNFSYVISLSMPGVATIYQGSDLNGGGDDGLHNFMALTSNDTLAVALHRETPGNQNPSSAGSVSVDCQAVLNRTITQTLALTQSAAIKKPTEIVDTLIFVNQTATCQRVRIREATNTITFTQDVEAYRAFAQSMVFTHDAAVTKVMFRTVTQTLSLTQAANRTTVLNRTVTDTLVLGQNRLVRTPIIGTINTSTPTPFEYYQPVAQAILVPIKCLVVLGVPSQTVILPCPEFGDSQGRTDSINLKRTMTGDTYTYVRKSDLQKLKYLFHMGSYKAAELKQFLVDHCHEVMTLINHKGETWYVNLANNPFEFVAAERWQKRGERHDVTLEFEGVQL